MAKTNVTGFVQALNEEWDSAIKIGPEGPIGDGKAETSIRRVVRTASAVIKTVNMKLIEVDYRLQQAYAELKTLREDLESHKEIIADQQAMIQLLELGASLDVEEAADRSAQVAEENHDVRKGSLHGVAPLTEAWARTVDEFTRHPESPMPQPAPATDADVADVAAVTLNPGVSII